MYTRLTVPTAAILLGSIASGCGSAVGTEESDSTSSSGDASSSSSGEPSTTVTSAATEVSTTTTGPLPTTTGPDPSTTTGGSTTGGPPPSVCDPQPALTEAFLDMQLIDAPDTDLSFRRECVVDSVDGMGGDFEVVVNCPAEPSPLFVVRGYSDPPSGLTTVLTVGTVLDVTVDRTGPADDPTTLFVGLRQEGGGDLIAGQYGPGAPPMDTDVTGRYTPLAFGAVDGLCEPDPGPDDDCPSDHRRLALDFTLTGTTTRIYDRNRSIVGPYDVHVGAAYRDLPLPELCADPEMNVIEWTALPIAE